jgi:hypothetical protein
VDRSRALFQVLAAQFVFSVMFSSTFIEPRIERDIEHELSSENLEGCTTVLKVMF